MPTTEYAKSVVTNAHASVAIPNGSRQECGGQIVCFAIGKQTVRLFIPSPFPTIKTGDEIEVGFKREPASGRTVEEMIAIVSFRKKIAPFWTNFRPRT